MENYIEQLKPIMANVSDKIGQGAEFGWEVILKQQYVVACEAFLWTIFGIITLIILNKTRKDIIKNTDGEVDWEYDNTLFLVFGILGSIIAVLAVLFGSIEFVKHLINPEYYALQFFINLVK